VVGFELVHHRIQHSLPTPVLAKRRCGSVQRPGSVTIRKLTYLIGSTIDGFIAGPDGGDPTMDGYCFPAPETY
jgi:hypothetical protein